MTVAIVNWPVNVPIAAMRLDLVGRTLRAMSPMTGREAVRTQPGASWQGVIILRNLLYEEWQEFEGFRADLLAGGKVMRLYDPRCLTFRGLADGNMLATGAANALVVTVTGIAGRSPFFRRGARFSIGERLHIVTADVTSAPGGTATVPIAPELREDVSGVSVNVRMPSVLLRLASDSEGAMQCEPGVDGPEVPDVAIAVREHMGPYA